MKATEIIRGLLDLIDNLETEKEESVDYQEETPDNANDIPLSQYSNSPDEHVTPVDTILSMGNDLNKPKHPADIRVSTVALYPGTAYKG